MANDYSTAPTVTGYKRSNWGEPFTVGTIGKSTSYKCNSWYECGITIPTQPEPPCFNTSTSCWYEYSFVHDTAWNGCTGGKRYVMKTKFTSAPIVGVELCNSTRYQIFLGGNLTDKFLNIGDGWGDGEDHCELVGGQEMDAVLPGTYGSAPALTGYARLYVGNEFNIHAIAGGTGYHSNPWYECEVQIPWPHEPACMSATPPCWYALNVSVDNTPSPCTGGQILVKRTNYTSAPYLAVQLCNSTRDFGPLGMEGSTLAEQNDIKVKGQEKSSASELCLHNRHLVSEQVLKPSLGRGFLSLVLTTMSFRFLGRLNAAIGGGFENLNHFIIVVKD
eukprot:XP_011435779.2 PREDICTED: fibronectin type III domain-containing protein 1 [Crassostrea gigas]